MNNLLDFEPKFSEDEMAMATFLATFSQICTSYPKINPQTHMRSICRSKGETKENPKKGNVEFVDPYSWGAKKLLKRTKDYYNEMLASGYLSDLDEYDEDNNTFEYQRTKRF